MRRKNWKSGNVAVEMAILTPVLLTLLAGVTDFGLGIYDKMQLVNAVRAGTQMALNDSSATAAIAAAVQGTLNLGEDAADISVVKACECPSGAAVNCSVACPDGAVRTYVTVSASTSHTWLLPFPGVENPITFNAQASIRTQ